MPLMPSTRDKISSYIINRCLDFQLEKLEVLIEKGFLKTMYGYKSCRNVCQDSLFLKRLFNSPREEFRKKLWLNVWHLQSEANGNNDFVRNLYSVCGMDFLTSSLKFTYSEGKENIVHNGRFFDLLGCLCNMLNPTMNPKIFLDFTDFTKPFLGVLNLWLNMPNLQIDKLFQLTSALLTLFVEDVKIYNEFQEDGIEELFEHNFMRMLIFYPLKPLHCIERLAN
ncbi:unnamed protein product [Allacma fusca]|uniref:Uncharacterized protein n=1 Tax=Allacma fusca TaxID=39272 RepID=A0A8J2KE50_9HEXA|nr:unnamed protein product [Allacma fusca]